MRPDATFDRPVAKSAGQRVTGRRGGILKARCIAGLDLASERGSLTERNGYIPGRRGLLL